VEVVLELLEALELAGHELTDRDAGLRGDDRRDLVSPTVVEGSSSPCSSMRCLSHAARS